MRTYSEQEGETPINWRKRLNRDPETISFEEWKLWEYQSRNWVTCACGNLCDALPRDRYGRPVDLDLACFGLDFNTAIEDKDLVWAKEILEKIEARSAYLLAEMGIKP